MKKLTLGFLISVFAASAYSDSVLTCLEKEQSVKTELESAQKNQQIGRVEGLTKALEEIQSHCTDDKLLSKYEDEVKESQQEVEEKTEKLKKAQADGRQDKITKSQRKLKEAQAELKEAQDELAQFKAKINQ